MNRILDLSYLFILLILPNTAFPSMHFVNPSTAFRSFQTVSINKETKVRLCLISDMNGPYGSIDQPSSAQSGIERLTEKKCDLVLGAGDLVAGQDLSLSDDRLHAMWDEWQRVVAEPFLAQRVPVLSALGNHDASAERTSSGSFIFNRERSAASAQWNTLVNHPAYAGIDWLSREQFPFYYAFKLNSIGVIVFDGTAAGEVSRNRAWLENQLDVLAKDANVKTRLVVGHLPLFAVAKGRENVGNILYNSTSLYGLFNTFRVDFYISGHHHAFFPGRVNDLAQNYGTVQLALGAMGDGPRKLLSASAPPPKTTLTLLDIMAVSASSPRFIFERFNIQSMSPLSGESQPIHLLPERLDSFDGQGNPVELSRFDL